MNIKDLTRKLGKIYPKLKILLKNDYLGFASGIRPRTTINKVIICLDVDHEVVIKAIENEADLIISHHPFLFGNKREVLKDPIKKDLYDKLFKHNIAVLSLHTNFDIAKEGMNVALLKKLETKNIVKSDDPNSFLYIGELYEEFDLDDFAEYVREKLELPYLTLKKGYCGVNHVKKIGIIAGSGSSFYLDAKRNNVDVFITGEIKLNIRQEMYWRGLNVIEIAHEIEKIFCTIMKQILGFIAPDINALIVDNQTYPKVFTAKIKI